MCAHLGVCESSECKLVRGALDSLCTAPPHAVLSQHQSSAKDGTRLSRSQKRLMVTPQFRTEKSQQLQTVPLGRTDLGLTSKIKPVLILALNLSLNLYLD